MERENILVIVIAIAVTLGAFKLRASGPACGVCPVSLALSLLPGEPDYQRAANKTGTQAPAPAWQLTDLDGRKVRLADFRGKVVVLNFWATWCPPCRREIPTFVALQKQHGDKGLVVVGVSLDQNGASAVKNFATRMGINYPIVIGDEKVAAQYGGILMVPTTFIIDRHGNVAAQHDGEADRSTFEGEIKSLL